MLNLKDDRVDSGKLPIRISGWLLLSQCWQEQPLLMI